MLLASHDFQAPGFYGRMGYEEQASVIQPVTRTMSVAAIHLPGADVDTGQGAVRTHV